EIADLALVVIAPEPERAPLAEPILRELESRGIPHVLFVNKIDKARGTLDELLEALQPLSAATLVARAMPISKDEEIVGFVDLALDRAFRFRPGKASERIALPAELEKEEQSARFHMLEQLADHDDYLLEQLLNEEEPDRETVFSDLRSETADGVVVPM